MLDDPSEWPVPWVHPLTQQPNKPLSANLEISLVHSWSSFLLRTGDLGMLPNCDRDILG